MHRKKRQESTQPEQIHSIQEIDRLKTTAPSEAEPSRRGLRLLHKDPGTPADEDEIGETVADPEGAYRHGYTPAA